MKTAKILAALLWAAMLAGVMAVPALAQDTMQVTYQVPDTYTVSIPSTITLPASGTANAEIRTTAQNISNGRQLIVTVPNSEIATSGNDHSITLLRVGDAAGSAKKVASAVTVAVPTAIDSTLASGQPSNTLLVATFKGTATGGASGGTLAFAAVTDADGDNIINAGHYAKTVTFTVTMLGTAPTV